VVEEADVDSIFYNAKHPYTQALLRSIPRLGLQTKERQHLESIRGTVPDPYALPKGCSFHPRCNQKMPGICDQQDPPYVTVGAEHKARCLLYGNK
jgi:oligopeptide/dipeptide ABC transporter ATP-binding protein